MKINGYVMDRPVGGMRLTEGSKKNTATDPRQGLTFGDRFVQEKGAAERTAAVSARGSIGAEPSVHAGREVSGMYIDKGTAAHTTVYVSQSAFDRIMSATTHNDRKPDWEEMGCDGNKRWVVINGQRFECSIKQKEKDKHKSLEEDLLDAILKHDKENKTHDHRGNIEALRGNEKVVELLHGIFGTTSFEDLLTTITGKSNYAAYA